MEQITPEHKPQPCASAAPYGSDLRSIPSAQGREQFDLFIAHIPQRMASVCFGAMRISAQYPPMTKSAFSQNGARLVA